MMWRCIIEQVYKFELILGFTRRVTPLKYGPQFMISPNTVQNYIGLHSIPRGGVSRGNFPLQFRREWKLPIPHSHWIYKAFWLVWIVRLKLVTKSNNSSKNWPSFVLFPELVSNVRYGTSLKLIPLCDAYFDSSNLHSKTYFVLSSVAIIPFIPLR